MSTALKNWSRLVKALMGLLFVPIPFSALFYLSAAVVIICWDLEIFLCSYFRFMSSPLIVSLSFLFIISFILFVYVFTDTFLYAFTWLGNNSRVPEFEL